MSIYHGSKPLSQALLQFFFGLAAPFVSLLGFFWKETNISVKTVMVMHQINLNKQVSAMMGLCYMNLNTPSESKYVYFGTDYQILRSYQQKLDNMSKFWFLDLDRRSIQLFKNEWVQRKFRRLFREIGRKNHENLVLTKTDFKDGGYLGKLASWILVLMIPIDGFYIPTKFYLDWMKIERVISISKSGL